MPLIEGNRLPQRFKELAGQAERIDVAVAWATRCDATTALEKNGAKIRAVVGVSGNSTNPRTLHRLRSFAKLRIAPDNPPRIFHPKYYCFHGERTICWIGSANLTGGGFGRNDELVHEFDLECDEDRNWFERLWATLDPNPMLAIREYEERYKPPRRTPPTPDNAGADPDLPSLADIETWSDFVAGLKAYDTYYRRHHNKYGFDVLGDTHSWLHTIGTGHKIVRRENWTDLTQRHCYILRGFTANDDDEGIWLHLGPVIRSGAYVFNPANMPEVEPIRRQVQEQITQVLQAGPNKIATVAKDAMMTIRRLKHVENAAHGIGPAAATRWLALARPDCMVSVNRASAPGLGEALGLPQNSNMLADRYDELINRLHCRPWFNEFNGRQPDDPLERDMWNRRAALVDVFVYKPRR